MKSILHPSFKYVPSVETDIRKTFARVRREQRLAKEAEERTKHEQRVKVRQLMAGTK
jgi:hypothetical protein